jgi:hypothetical protein
MASADDDNCIAIEIAALHEAGHIVIAAAQNLKLRPEGLGVDPHGEGLACYCKDPEDCDVSRERVLLSTFAGFKAEKHFRAKRGFEQRDPQRVIDSADWWEARGVIGKLSNHYLSGRTVWSVMVDLEDLSEQLVRQHELAIEGVAGALLAKEYEPVKPLKSGSVWTKATVARYVTGQEAVEILAKFGITAIYDTTGC